MVCIFKQKIHFTSGLGAWVKAMVFNATFNNISYFTSGHTVQKIYSLHVYISHKKMWTSMTMNLTRYKTFL